MKRVETARGSFSLNEEDIRYPSIASILVCDLLRAVILAIKEQDPAKARRFYDSLTYQLYTEGGNWLA